VCFSSRPVLNYIKQYCWKYIITYCTPVCKWVLEKWICSLLIGWISSRIDSTEASKQQPAWAASGVFFFYCFDISQPHTPRTSALLFWWESDGRSKPVRPNVHSSRWQSRWTARSRGVARCTSAPNENLKLFSIYTRRVFFVSTWSESVGMWETNALLLVECESPARLSSHHLRAAAPAGRRHLQVTHT
jgi:hypothetical protein